MENYLLPAITVPFETLFLDPNNPRLGQDELPGYSDLNKLFNRELQASLETKIQELYDVSGLEQAIIGQGWMPIDNLIVWTPSGQKERHIVVEGNTRTVTLRKIRIRLAKEKDKLDRMVNGRSRYANHDIKEQESLVERLRKIVGATDNITVVPIDANNIDELNKKLPRVLAVRHITGAKDWGSYAEDLYLLTRYEDLFGLNRPEEDRLRWDPILIQRVADEASLSLQEAKRKLKTSSIYSRFKRDFEDQLPYGEEFVKTDYYLFELIVKKPWVRQQFGLLEDDLHIPADRAEVLFKWVFQKVRGKTADENPNVFYRHENITLWDQMKRYDDKNKTNFASRFDVSAPDAAPTMHEVEADYLSHKSRRKPSDVIQQLLNQIGAIDTRTLLENGVFITAQLEQLNATTTQLLNMLEAIEAK